MENQEEVLYSYTGDVSSLRDATQEAIELLTKYEHKIKDITSSGGFEANKTSTTEFQRSLNGVVRQVNAITKSVQKLEGSSKQFNIPDTSSIVSAGKDMADVLDYVSDATKVTTEDVKLMSSVLRDTQSTLKSYTLALSQSPSTLLKVAQLKPAASTQPSAPVDDALSTSIASTTTTPATTAAAHIEVPNIPDMVEETLKSLRTIEEATKATTSSVKQEIYKMIESVSPALASKLQSLESRMRSTLSPITKKVAEVSAAFRRVGTSGDAAEGSVKRLSRQHQVLQKVVQKLRGSLKVETRAINSEDKTLKNKNNTLKLATKLHNGFSNVLRPLSRLFRYESNQALNLSRSLKTMTGHTKYARGAIAALIGVPFARWLAQSIKNSVNFAETLNLFEVATAGATDEAKAFVGQMQELYGMDPQNIMRYVGNYRQLADAIDMPDEAATKLSLGLTKATNDIASLFNMPIEQVFQNLSSGMQGMSRAVRKYGMDIRTTTLEQTALSLGITENVRDMSEADRQGLRYITMMRQASNAINQVTTDVNGNTVIMGDFAKTIEQPANQLRIFKEQVTQLGRAIGDFFVKPLSVAIQYINGFVMALRMVIQFIGSLLGVVSSLDTDIGNASLGMQDTADSVGGIGDAAEETSKKLKALRNTLAPFDELNLLQAPPEPPKEVDNSSSFEGVMNPEIAQAVENLEIRLEKIRMKANEVRDALLTFFGFKFDAGRIISWDPSVFEANLIEKFPQWTESIRATFDNWSDIVGGFKNVFWSLVGVAREVKERVLELLHIDDTTVATFIGNLADNLNRLSTWITDHSTDIANLVIAFGAFKLLTPVLVIVITLVGWVFKAVEAIMLLASTLSGLSAPVMLVIGLIAVLAGTLVDLWKTNESFRESVSNAWKSLVSLLKNLWETVLKPVIDEVVRVVNSIYEQTIKPIVERLSRIILTLWTDVLQPVLNWIINNLGPSVVNVIKDILKVVEWFFNTVGDFIEGILIAIQGVVDFIAGVFTGDLNRAATGILNIFVGIGNSIVSVAQAIVNSVISAINLAISAIWNGLVGMANSALDILNAIGGWFGWSWYLHINYDPPQIPYMNVKPFEVPMAKGGVVTGPTSALIGEGRYDEAVIPLGNSPQMRDFADQVAERSQNAEQTQLLREQNELLRQILNKKISIDGKQLSDVVTTNQRRQLRATGGF